MLAFGTDGVRGDARGELTGEAVEALGRAACEVLGAAVLAVGRDPRVSGLGLVEALCRGVAAAGGSMVDLGVLPTPAVARWCADEQVAGAMVSASHNPWHDNGVKLFAPGGRKLNDAAQRDIERRWAGLLAGRRAGSETSTADGADTVRTQGIETGGGALAPASSPAGSSWQSGGIGGGGGTGPSPAGGGLRVRGLGAGGGGTGERARLRHIDSVAASLEGRDLSGLRIVLDAANGAAHRSGPECLRGLGAEVEVIHAAPDGHNINDGCGSQHPGSLRAAVLSWGGDAGIALDGDADRAVAVDSRGALVDGDQILAVCAIDRARRGRLRGGAVVITVMANLGLRQALAARGIDVVETPVGDRHVLSAMEERGLALGGEQSGHLIFRDMATTGDGLLTAVQLLDTVKRSGRGLGDLAAAAMTRLPQVLVAVPMPAGARSQGLGGGGVPHSSRISQGLDGALAAIAAAAPQPRRAAEQMRSLDGALAAIAAAAQARLGGGGRVLVRRSGTEPLVRVMVEAACAETAQAEAEQVAALVAEALS